MLARLNDLRIAESLGNIPFIRTKAKEMSPYREFVREAELMASFYMNMHGGNTHVM